VDLVHAHFGTDATAIWPSVKAAGLPMVVTLHGKDINTSRQWWEAGRGGMRRRVYPRRLLRMSRDPQVSFIAVSKAIARRAMAYGIPKDKITLHYIGVDTEVFKPDGLPVCQRRNRILFVGRLVDKKAPLLLIQAYAQVRSAVRDAELVIIGTGPLLDRAIRLARELAVPVDFLGARSPGEVLAHIQQARVCCLPSITAANGDAEGFGMVLLEAQACGVPVVTSARGGAAEGLLHGRTGYSVPERDIKALIVALTSILTDDQLCEAMSRESRKFVEKTFDLQQHAYELEHHYERVAELSKNSRGQE
jgi:glycosyltransferase involved in cell wall biosynthesis